MRMANFPGLPIKTYLTVGSYPLKYLKFGEDARFLVNDIDVICWEMDITCKYEKRDDYQASFEFEGKRIECLLADKQQSLQELLLEYHPHPCPELLFILVSGHINYPSSKFLHFIDTYTRLSKMVQMTPRIEELIKLHKKCTKERKGIRRSAPKLIGVTKEKFFDDKVVKYMVHDDIHQIVAHREYPMYHYMQKDHSKVECSRELWDGFTRTEKIMCVLEECYVIALERHIIPQIFEGTPGLSARKAFEWALMRVCTTLCSGWFRDFAVDNYYVIMSNRDVTYVDVFLKALDGIEREKETLKEMEELLVNS